MDCLNNKEDFKNFFISEKEEEKYISLSDFNISNNPYLSYEGFSNIILNRDIKLEDMISLLEVNLSFVINSIITGLNPKFKYLINNKTFRMALIDMSKRCVIDGLDMVYLTRIMFDYINSFGINDNTKDTITDLLEISINLYPKHAQVLKTVGFDTSTIGMLLIAKNSTDDQKVSIRRFNDVLIHNNPDVCTIKNIRDIYLSLFDIEKIFSSIMFDIKYDFADNNVKTIYRNISLALLEALECCNPHDISKILWDYSLNNPDENVRFKLKESPLGSNTTSIIKMLESKGIYIR